ncbi:MAG: outer membrane beta-barrel protein [Roseibium sp.]
MHRFLPILACLATLQVSQLAAQTALPDLRGTDEPDDIVTADDGSNQAVERADPNPTQANVFALRGRLNSAEAEIGSSGLGANGRVVPVRPFSDRLAAVNRSARLSQGRIDESVFGGDTTFDTPRGIRIGSFTLIPQLTTTGGWSDNTSRSPTGKPGGFYRIAPDFALTSDWVRHQFDASLRGSYAAFPSNRDDDDASGTATASLRLDVSESTQVDGDISYSLSREEDGSAESSSGITYVHDGTATLSGTRNVGLIAATAEIGADRTQYNSDDTDESGRDNTVFSASLRLDGNAGGLLSPFTEGSLLFRRFDQTCSDSLCEQRDANGYELRGGVAIAAGPKLVGEIGLGWRIEDLEDRRLNDLAGLLVDGSLVWSPSRLTTVTAGVGTSFEATDIDGASGSIIYSGDLRLAHGFSDRFVGEVGVGYSYRTYQGAAIEERTLNGRGGLTFALTKNVAVTTNYLHRRFDSSSDGSDYTENAVEAGLRFRH